MKRTLCLCLSLLLLLCCVPALAADIDGVWADGIYANAFADLRFHLPEGWWVYPENRLADVMELSAKAYRAADVEGIDFDALASPEMSLTYVLSRQGLSAMTIQVESSTYQGEPLALSDYLDINLRLLEGTGYRFPLQEEVEIQGHAYTASKGTAEVGGFTMVSHNYVREQDGHFIVILALTHSEDEMETLLSHFE